MNCRRVSSLLSAYIDGELTGVEMLAIRSHMSTCGDCASECESIRLTKQMLGRLRTTAPRDGICDAIMGNLSPIQVDPLKKLLDEVLAFPRFRFAGLGTAAAVCGFALLLMVLGVAQIYDEIPASSNQSAYTVSALGDFSVGSMPHIPGLPENISVIRPIPPPRYGSSLNTSAFPIVTVGFGE